MAPGAAAAAAAAAVEAVEAVAAFPPAAQAEGEAEEAAAEDHPNRKRAKKE